MRYIDCHTHVHFAAFAEDYREAIGRAAEAGVMMITVGTQRDTSLRAIEVAREYPGRVYATVGLHPIHTEESHHDAKELGEGEAAKAFTSRGEEFDPERYRMLAGDPAVVAIGECGLDYYRLTPDTKEKQAAVFREHIRIAHDAGKPLMIHCRNAFPDLIALLREEKENLASEPGVVHFFSGTSEDAHALLELGFGFTFGGVITFTNDYDAVIRMIPDDRIMSETDAPYVAPVPYRGKRNEPAYVVEVVRRLAVLRGVSEEAMAARIMENARRVFRLPQGG